MTRFPESAVFPSYFLLLQMTTKLKLLPNFLQRKENRREKKAPVGDEDIKAESEEEPVEFNDVTLGSATLESL